MTFESAGLLIVAIYIWLPPASYVVFLTTLVISTLLFRSENNGVDKVYLDFYLIILGFKIIIWIFPNPETYLHASMQGTC